MNEKVGFDFKISKEQINCDDYTSALTKQLMSEYDVDGVVYIIHLPGGNETNGSENLKRRFNGRTFPKDSDKLNEMVNTPSFNTVNDEYCLIKGEEKSTIMHEICHLYGAEDYYETNKALLSSYTDFTKLDSK